MPRKQQRARDRRARLNMILDRIDFAKSPKERVDAIESLGKFLAGVEAGGGRVWPFRKQIEKRYAPDKYGDEERLVVGAMIADVVAPWLSGSTRGSVNRRNDSAKEIVEPCRERKAYGLDDESKSRRSHRFGK